MTHIFRFTCSLNIITLIREKHTLDDENIHQLVLGVSLVTNFVLFVTSSMGIYKCI